MRFYSHDRDVKNNQMNLLVVSEAMVCKLSGEYYSDDSFLYFVSHFEKYFKSILLCIPVFGDNLSGKSLEGPLPLDLFKVVETYPYKNVLTFYKKMPIVFLKNFFKFFHAVQEADVVFLRIPAMNAFFVFILAKICKKSVVCYVVGDEVGVVKEGKKYRGLSRFAALAIAHLHSFLYKQIIRFSQVSFFLNRKIQSNLTKRKSNSYFIFTNLIRKDEVCTKKSLSMHRPIRLLYVGRLSHEKGIEYLLRAVKILVSQDVKFKLSVCGDGPDREMATHLCDVLKLKNHVDMLGHMRRGVNLNKVYKSSDVFILPSLSEGVPKVLLEAMAQGLPIISTNVGGIPDVIKNNENGILVPSKSAEAIADAINLVLRDDSLRKKIVQNGHTFVMAHTAEKQAEKIANIIYKHVGR